MINADISINEIYWIAGFLEGEGAFARCGGTITVTVSQVQREPLERMQKFVGGNIYACKAKRPNASDFFRWAVFGQTAEDLMKAVFPIMSPRRQAQINKAISWYATRHGRNFVKSSRQLCRKGHPWTPENIYVFPKRGTKVCKICKLSMQKKCNDKRALARQSNRISHMLNKEF